jgi:hypothetical protein
MEAAGSLAEREIRRIGFRETLAVRPATRVDTAGGDVAPGNTGVLAGGANHRREERIGREAFGVVRFTAVDWEHCGMLLDAEYKRRWELKQQWYRGLAREPMYRDNGVLPLAEGGGAHGILVATSDDSQTGFNATEIGKIIDPLFGSA